MHFSRTAIEGGFPHCRWPYLHTCIRSIGRGRTAANSDGNLNSSNVLRFVIILFLSQEWFVFVQILIRFFNQSTRDI